MSILNNVHKAVENDNYSQLGHLLLNFSIDEDTISWLINQATEHDKTMIGKILVRLENPYINKHLFKEAIYHDNYELVQFMLYNNIILPTRSQYRLAEERDLGVAPLLLRYLEYY